MAGSLIRCWVFEDAVGGKYYADFLFDTVMSTSTSVAGSIEVSPDNGVTTYTPSSATMVTASNNKYLRIEVDSTFASNVGAEGDADKQIMEVKLTAGAFKDSAEANCDAIAYADDIRCHVINTTYATLINYETQDADGFQTLYLPKSISIDCTNGQYNGGITIQGYDDSTKLTNCAFSNTLFPADANATFDNPTNNDFENFTGANPDNWTQTGANTTPAENNDSAYINSGSSSLKLVYSATGTDVFSNSKSYTFTNGKRYFISAYIADGGGTNFPVITFRIKNSSTSQTQDVLTMSETTGVLSGSFTVNNTGYDTLEFTVNSVSGTWIAYLDNIKIKTSDTEANNQYLYIKKATCEAMANDFDIDIENGYQRFENVRFNGNITVSGNEGGTKYIVLDRCWRAGTGTFLGSSVSDVYWRVVNSYINADTLSQDASDTVISYCNNDCDASGTVFAYNSYMLESATAEVDNTNKGGLTGITLANSQTGSGYTSGGLLKVGRQFSDFLTEMVTGVPVGSITSIGAFQNAISQQITVSSASLGSDNKTVTLTLSSSLTSGESYGVEINNVESTSGDVIEKGTLEFFVSS